MSKKVSFYKRLGDHIEQQITFDMKGDAEGYPTIHWIIARTLLGDYTEFERYKLLESYVANVKNNLNHAIMYLEDKGINIYKSIPKGKKNIQFITTDSNYRDARARDYHRSVNRTLGVLKSFGSAVELKHDDRLAVVGSETKRLTNKLETTL